MARHTTKEREMKKLEKKITEEITIILTKNPHIKIEVRDYMSRTLLNGRTPKPTFKNIALYRRIFHNLYKKGVLHRHPNPDGSSWSLYQGKGESLAALY